ncbi:hypothetical protein INT43_000296 [Umbelopsis isabellina]|uniref:Uncharacterized protein n=1 Tax=Mortierella isabellina TaxID=91625 RepID=A0A8H7UJU4_MORIS|nr:hypothetical protein INT43_000296 [Umbelopsis isabellina]
MGNCVSASNVEDENTRNIDQELREEKNRLAKEIKLLLLGAGESGKSTILKQMRLIHSHHFTDEERETFRGVIFDNIMVAMLIVLEAMEALKINLEIIENRQYVALFAEIPSIERGGVYPESYLVPIKSLLADPGVQKAFSQGNSFALDDNANFQLDRLFTPGYIPTDDDIIRTRVKTTGIAETVFKDGSLTYRMVDVGGQRSERKKWIHCFEGVTAIMFVVAISGYDACLVEDKDSNQMHEALMLFDSITNSSWFKNTSVILFLNKIDVFKKKLKVSPVSKYFPDYTGDDLSFDETRNYFRNRFERLTQNKDKILYVHYTDATDTKLLRHVMNAVSDTILRVSVQSLLM